MAKKRIIDLTNEELAKQEEEQNLYDIEESIDSVILDNKNKISELDNQISEDYVLDSEDRDRKIYLLLKRKSYKESIEKWEGYKDSPYFGRMDIVATGSEVETYFIGDTNIEDGSRIFVIDWREPVGEAYYNKQTTKYTIKGIDYRLILRRAIKIKQETVLEVHTEYDDVSLAIDGDVIDPFLLSVLRDKRRNYKLTDIIRTIQSNQNDLIRKPLEESFIVQGCAGSGKTMILLHRLSFIAFNYPKFDFSRCCILTPNEYFNLHIDELSHSLGLDKIKRYTVEGFYVSWIRYLGRNDAYYNPAETRRPSRLKVEPVTETVASEKLLNPDMLEEIYSRQFYDSYIERYEDHWNTLLAQIEYLEVCKILAGIGKTVPDKLQHNFITYSFLKRDISDVLSAHLSAKAEYDKSKSEFEYAEIQIETRNNALSSIYEPLKQSRDALLADLNESESELSSAIQSIIDTRKEAREKIEEAESKKTEKLLEMKSEEDVISLIMNDRDNLIKVSYLRSSDSEIAHFILENCANELQRYEEAQILYNKVPFYNFGKRSRAKADLDKAFEALSKNVDQITGWYLSDHSSKVEALHKEIDELNFIIIESNRVLTSSEVDSASEKKLRSVSKCKKLFGSDQWPDLEKDMRLQELDDLPESYKQYIMLYRNYRDERVGLRAAERLRDESKAIIEKNKGSIISVQAQESLEKAIILVEQLDFSTLFSILENELKKVYSDYNKTISNRAVYRHELIYKLLLCSLYYEYKTDTQYFINIDEAQDLSEIEYSLLRRILGPKAIFNLYGDVNQLVYDFKGITQWEDLSDIITPNLFFLNENYRNTLQITDYCNRKFSAEITGIGLSGEEVVCLSFDRAMTRLVRIKKETSECRAAVIYRRGVNGIVDLLSQYGDMCVFNQIDPKKISVITVEEAKGLEFDAVMVIETTMTINEQYISYTRALDNLIITDVPGAYLDADKQRMHSD